MTATAPGKPRRRRARLGSWKTLLVRLVLGDNAAATNVALSIAFIAPEANRQIALGGEPHFGLLELFAGLLFVPEPFAAMLVAGDEAARAAVRGGIHSLDP